VCVGGVYYVGDQLNRSRGKRVTCGVTHVYGSRATFVERIGRVERPVSWSSFPYGKGNEMIYESRHIYVNIRTLNRL